MAAQDDVGMLVNQGTRFAGVEFTQVIPRVMQQGDAEIRTSGIGRPHGLVDLVSPHQEFAAVLLLPGHPGRVESGNVDRRAADIDGALPPGKALG
jgi:hypothetical protein